VWQSLRESFYLEAWAVNATAFWATNLVNQRKFESAVAVGGGVEARRVDIVAETDGELLIVEAGAHDKGIHQFAGFQFVGHTRPGAQLEGLVVAAAVAEQEFERVTRIHLEGGALEEGYHARYQTETFADHKFTTRVEGEFAVERDVGRAERLVGPVQVAERAAEVEVVVFIKNAEPKQTGGHVEEQEVRVGDYFFVAAGCAVLALAVVLARPFERVAVDAALAHTQVGAEHQIVGFAAVAAHFFGIRAGQTRLQGGKFRFAGFISP
jgi:hypothetical protein